MKLNKQTNAVQRGGVKSESTFSIQTSAHAFEILSSGLYTDSVSAIVRELSCNAYDAHVMAGNKDSAFDIHIPSRMEPWFAIRDYGTGLSHEDVLSVYTTYFQSTKSNSDDFIGALGLGSKSPFSYSDDFQVTSFYDGVEYKYAIFLNEEGVPSVALMGEVVTDQPNGIEVRLPSEDHRRFLSAVGKYLAYFNVHPNVLGVDQSDINGLYSDARLPANSELDEIGKWFIADRENSYYSSRVGIVYGQVPYPANVDTITNGAEALCTREEIDFYKSFSDRIVLIFEVGELSITANREELKYDEDTLKAIAGRISEFHKKFFTQVKDAIENFAHNDSLYKTIRYLMTDVFHNEVQFLRSIDFSLIDVDAFKVLETHRNNWGGGFGCSVQDAFNNAKATLYDPLYLESYYSNAHDEDKVRASRGKYADCLGTNGELVYYVIDETRNGLAKAKQDFESIKAGKTNYIVIKPRNLKECDSKEHAAELAKIVTSLGNPDVILTSTLDYEAPTRTKRAKSVGKVQIGTVFAGAPHWNHKSDLKFEGGGIYVYLAGGTKMYKGSKATYENDVFSGLSSANLYNGLIKMYNEVKGTSHTNADLIGVSAADLKAFDKSDKWINIVDVVEAHVLANQEAMHLAWQESTTFSNSYREIGDSLNSPSFYNVFSDMTRAMDSPSAGQVMKNLDESSDFYKMMVILQELTAKKDTLISNTLGYSSLLNSLADREYRNVSTKDDRFEINLDAELLQLENQFPLLGMIDRWNVEAGDNNTLQIYVDYITMIEKS